ncbi:MAG: hypothetical protein QW780_02135 [Sulfolobales archaeon]
MTLNKLSLPPRIKVMEAMGALADGRIESVGGSLFKVVSSDRTRTYRVYVEMIEQGRFRVCSTDNGTVYRGYSGYPILSVLMVLGYLHRDVEVERALAGIPWRRLNESLKKYTLVESEVLKLATSRGVSPSRVNAAVAKVLENLKNLTLLFDPSACGGVDYEKEDTD